MPSVDFTYKTVPGPPSLRIPAYVHYSPLNSDPIRNASLRARPIAILFHGGGFAAGSTSMIPESQITALTRLGFVVVLPEYRLCPQVSLEEGPMEDARDCLRWARETLPVFFRSEGILVNGDRVAAVGYSAGGALALSLGALPDPPTAILDFYGTKYLSDSFWRKAVPPFTSMPSKPVPESFHYSPIALTAAPLFVTKEPNFSDPRIAYVIAASKAGTLLADAVKGCDVEKIEPTRAFGEEFPPTCFVHGTGDEMVPLEMAQRAVKELKRKGGKAELLEVKGAGHGFDMQIGPGDQLFDGVVMTALMWLADRV